MVQKAGMKLAQAIHLYRYRTSVLVGPWRKSETLAVRDALRARQALRDEQDRQIVRWLVPGGIEQRDADVGAG